MYLRHKGITLEDVAQDCFVSLGQDMFDQGIIEASWSTHSAKGLDDAVAAEGSHTLLLECLPRCTMAERDAGRGRL